MVSHGIFVRARWIIICIATVLLAAIALLYLSLQRNFAGTSTLLGSSASSGKQHDDALSAEPLLPEGPTPRIWPEFEIVPLHESFPEAVNGKTALDLPRVPSWNTPPAAHVPEDTPLFIGFTRNWQMLQQVVVSYITAGWPPADIYVVENTGVMHSNLHNLLTEENPFYLDHHRLDLLGVNVLITPTYLSFAQLQNFYLFESLKRKYATYFWSHMDVVVHADEDREPYQSFYMRAVEAVREAMAPGFAREGRWSVRFFAYDWLTLVNTDMHVELGGWDTMIGYYKTDCDMYERARMTEMPSSDARCGKIWDVASVLDDIGILYRRKMFPQASTEPPIEIPKNESVPARPTARKRAMRWMDEEDERNSTAWHDLRATLRKMEDDKGFGTNHRNSWQRWQQGGKGQPFYKDINGFEESLEHMYRAGELVYSSKWGTDGCNLWKLRTEDAWRVNQWKDP